MKFKKIITSFSIILLILSFVSGCGLLENATDNQLDKIEDLETNMDYSPSYGGEIALALTKLDTLNPLMTENINYYFFSKLIYDSLFEFDNTFNVKNKLVRDYDISEDGRIINISLREDVLWHDGEPLTSADVEFTINTIKYAPDNSTYKKILISTMGLGQLFDVKKAMEVKVIDNYRLTISYDKPFGHGLELLTFPIIPKHIYTNGRPANKDYANALKLDDFRPIGSGPYKFESYDKMKRVVLRSNENYREAKPYIDKIVGIVLNNDESIVTAFETGQINIATTLESNWDKYHNNSRIKVLEFISNNYEFIAFNSESPAFKDKEEEEKNILKKAIAYSIDRHSIIEKLYLGHASQIDVPIHPNSYLLSEDAYRYGFNLDLAMAELKKLDESEKINLKLLTNSYNTDRFKMAELIKADLEKLGIEIDIIPNINPDKNPSEEDLEKQWETINNFLAKGEYDMALLGWDLSAIPDLSFAFHSSNIASNTNFIKYNYEKMDLLLEDILLDGNRTRKKENYNKIQDLILEDLPYYSLFFKNEALLVDRKIVGDLDPSFFNIYKGLEKAFIPKDLQ